MFWPCDCDIQCDCCQRSLRVTSLAQPFSVPCRQLHQLPASYAEVRHGAVPLRCRRTDARDSEYREPLDFELPILRNGRENWRRWIDTALDPPNEICEWNSEQPVLGTTYRAAARSVVALIAGEGRMLGISTPVSCHNHDGWNWSRDEQCSEIGGALSAESPDLYGLARPRSQQQSIFCLGDE